MNVDLLEVEIQRLQLKLAENEDTNSDEYKEDLDKLERLSKLLTELKKLENEEERIRLGFETSQSENIHSIKKAKWELIVKILMIVATLALGFGTIYAEGTRAITSKAIQIAKCIRI